MSSQRPKRIFWSRAAILVAICALPLTLVNCSVTVEPRRGLLPKTEPVGQFRHNEFDAVLAAHVDYAGNVDYAALHAAPDDLERHYARIAQVSPDSHRDRFADDASRLAYWINAYNTAVLVSVVRLYPLASVKDAEVPWYQFYLPDLAGFFYRRQHVFGGETHNLYDLENSIVRARFADPRVHFALNCASAGCPRLPRTAFHPATLDAELERETHRFFAEPRNLRVDDTAQVVHLSQILDWYRADFLDWLSAQGVSDPSPLEYAARYADDETRRALRGRAAGYRVAFTPYDWRLNDRGLRRH